MKTFISNFVRTNKNLSISIIFTILTSLIYNKWYFIFIIFLLSINLSLIINLVNWPYKVFKGESFSFFKQYLVWIKILPTFISIFYILFYYSTKIAKEDRYNHLKTYQEFKLNDSSLDSELYNRLRELELERLKMEKR